jgi:tetratricopeptide (TPR) repeat protein
LPLQAASQYRTLSRNGLSYADLVSYGIDAESLGDGTIDAALDFARLFRRACHARPIAPIVILPRFGAEWEDEDVLFLTLLAREIENAGILLVCCDDTPATLPSGWVAQWTNAPRTTTSMASDILSLVPETIAPDSEVLCAAAGGPPSRHVQLPGGWLVVAPECRRDPRDVPKLQWDRLAVLAREVDASLAAYAQYHGNNLYVDADAMCREAWNQFAQGGAGLALRYMARVERCAVTPADKAVAQVQKQGMRIAQRRFGEAAHEPEPVAVLSPAIRSFLLQSKGWGLVHTSAVAAARGYLTQAQELLATSEREGREYLYLLNIKALAEIRCGDVEAALHLEKRIEGCLGALQRPDWQLAYVNAMNQARIYKHLRDWPNSARYYQSAFAITSGLRSESDSIYTNVCLAVLAEAEERAADALLAWVRAALHWLASSRPETLSWRIAQALVPGLPLVEEPGRRCMRLVDEVSAALLRKLTQAQQFCGLTPPKFVQARCRHFLRLEEAPAGGVIHAAIGGDGWSVLATTTEAEEPYRGKLHAKLRAWMGEWIESESGVAAGNSYCVDSRCGKEMAVSVDDLVETCVRLRVSVAFYQGNRIDLHADTMQALERLSLLQVGNGVDTLDGEDQLCVRFKRYRPSRRLTADEARFVLFAEQTGSFEDGGAGLPEKRIALMRSLEEARVIDCILERRVCVAAGIRLPSSVS